MMLDYTKAINVMRIIPRTLGRFHITAAGEVYDKFHGGIVPWEVDSDDNVICKLPTTIYSDGYNPEELVALTFKPLYIPDENLQDVELLQKAGTGNTFPIGNPKDLLWRFPQGIESLTYPGFRFIPGFTRYLASADGEIISTFTGERVTTYIGNNGYLAARLVRDDDHDKIMMIHTLVALSWCSYDEHVCTRVVDHVNGDKLCNKAENLEWVTQNDNARRAHYHGFYGKKMRVVNVRDIKTGVTTPFESPAAVARFFGVSNSSIFHCLNSPNPNVTFKGTHLIWYEGFEGGIITQDHINAREGSQKRSLLVKNVVTGEIVEWESGNSFVRESGLTRKQVFGNLERKNQKRFDDIIFKYADDETPWSI